MERGNEERHCQHVCAEHDDGVSANVGNDGHPFDDAAQQQNRKCASKAGEVKQWNGAVVLVQKIEVLTQVHVVYQGK